MTDKTKFSLSETDMVSTRRVAIRSLAAKAGLVAGVIAAGAVATAGTAMASDRARQTDRDRNDYVGQTDND